MTDLERSRVYDGGDEPSGGQKPSDVELSRRRNKGAMVQKLLAESNALRAERDQLAAEKAELERQLGGRAKHSSACLPELSDNADHAALASEQIQEFLAVEERPELVVHMRNVGSNVIVTRTTTDKLPEYVKPPQTSNWYEEYYEGWTHSCGGQWVNEQIKEREKAERRQKKSGASDDLNAIDCIATFFGLAFVAMIGAAIWHNSLDAVGKCYMLIAGWCLCGGVVSSGISAIYKSWRRSQQ